MEKAVTITTPIDAEQDSIQVRKLSGGITTIGINRPHKKNSINPPTAKKLRKAFLDFEQDPSQKVCVFHGTNGNFCSGFDLNDLANWARPAHIPADESYSITRSRFEAVQGRNSGPLGPSRMQMQKPVICAIAGHAVAGGLELSLIADMRVVEEDAIFGVFSRRFGVPLLDGGTVRLQAVVGLGRAMDILVTGRPVKAQEALNIGLANRIVPKGKALEEAIKLARLIASFPQECVNADRQSSYYAAYQAKSLEDALSFEFEEGTKVSDLAIEGALRFAQGTGKKAKL